jgi:hypothetical protein
MLTESQRWQLISNFGIDPDCQQQFLALLDAIGSDPIKAGLVTHLEGLMVTLEQVEISIQKTTTKEAGIIRADVVEFNDVNRLNFSVGRREEILDRIAKAIGWNWEIKINAF